jgi:NAD-dependent dihydropyrimidine dehydrogenase PreA subunit
MTFVITEPCVDVKDGSCLDVCPVDCIVTRPGANQYFIDPERCIDCDVCVPSCPVDAIYRERDVPEQWRPYIQRNADFFQDAAS